MLCYALPRIFIGNCEKLGRMGVFYDHNRPKNLSCRIMQPYAFIFIFFALSSHKNSGRFSFLYEVITSAAKIVFPKKMQQPRTLTFGHKNSRRFFPSQTKNRKFGL